MAQTLLSYAQPCYDSPAVTTVLDLGCGPGTLSLTLAGQQPRLQITAVDSSPAMIALARQEADRQGLQNLHCHLMDAGHIAIDPDSFAVVLCNLAFPFFPHPETSMRAVFAAVSPGGTACFSVPGRQTWQEFFEIASTRLGDSIRVVQPFLTKFAQAETLPSAMMGAGFTYIQETRTQLPFHFSSGEAVLAFFAKLFHLLDYVSLDLKTELADTIDRAHPHGFTMHYGVGLLTSRRPTS